MPEQSNDYRVAIFGAGGVGKSSIVERFVRGSFNPNYVPTIEDTYRQIINCNRQQNVCTLQITDTTGSHQFPAMQRLSISRGHAFILVYSVDKADSFLHLESIYNEITSVKGTSMEDTPIVLVGNKMDEPDQNKKVKTNIGRARADQWAIGFIETSAKNDINVTEMFQLLLSLEKRRSLSLQPTDENEKKKTKKKQEKNEKKRKKEEAAAAKKQSKQDKQEKPEKPSEKPKPSEPEEGSKKKCSIM